MNKLKTDSKFRKNAIAITAASLVVVICAVSIPVGLHVRNTNMQQAAEITTVPIAETTTLLADAEAVSVTESTTLAETVSETAAASDANDNDQGSQAGSGNRTSNQSKPTTTKAPSTTKKPESTASSGTYNWTRAQAESFVAKARAYGESIGLIWDESFSIEAQNASWNASVWTSKNKTEARMMEQMKEQLDDHKYGQKGAKHFKIQAEYNEPTTGNWEFTILYM